MVFIDNLRQGPWTINDIQRGRINLLNEGVITIFGIKRLESEALFISSEGIGNLRETAKITFAGKERYWFLARKVNGVVRRVLLDAIDPAGCSVDSPCINCPVCSLLGGLSAERGRNQALFSRLKIQDLISIEPYLYEEQFRVKLKEENLISGRGTTPFQEITVPPGTRFPFIVRVFKPTKFDLAAFFYANKVADTLGYGNYTKLRGDATTNWLIISDGMAFISTFDFLSSIDSGKTMEDWVNNFISSPKGIVGETLAGDVLSSSIEDLISWFIKENKVNLQAQTK